MVSSRTPLLLLQDIYVGYQGFDILKGVSMVVNPGEIVCIIGPNGAGKTTVFKAIYGFLKLRLGKIWFDGHNVTDFRPQDMLRAGITFVPQYRSLFPQMTVYENLELGMYLERDKQRIKRRIDYIYDLFPVLAKRANKFAGMMSGGEQRMLEIGRALMSEPKMILLDEPSAGLAPSINKLITHTICNLNKEAGLTILLIEQNAKQGLQISDRGYVLELGKNSYEGTGQALMDNPEVRQAFLGTRKL